MHVPKVQFNSHTVKSKYCIYQHLLSNTLSALNTFVDIYHPLIDLLRVNKSLSKKVLIKAFIWRLFRVHENHNIFKSVFLYQHFDKLFILCCFIRSCWCIYSIQEPTHAPFIILSMWLVVRKVEPVKDFNLMGANKVTIARVTVWGADSGYWVIKSRRNFCNRHV